MKPVVVRWNSLYDALKQITNLKAVIPKASEALNAWHTLGPTADAVDKVKTTVFGHLFVTYFINDGEESTIPS